MRFSVIVEKPLKVKYILCHSNPAVRTPIVNYGQFFFIFFIFATYYYTFEETENVTFFPNVFYLLIHAYSG